MEHSLQWRSTTFFFYIYNIYFFLFLSIYLQFLLWNICCISYLIKKYFILTISTSHLQIFVHQSYPHAKDSHDIDWEIPIRRNRSCSKRTASDFLLQTLRRRAMINLTTLLYLHLNGSPRLTNETDIIEQSIPKSSERNRFAGADRLGWRIF